MFRRSYQRVACNFALFFGIGLLLAGGASLALRSANRAPRAADETATAAEKDTAAPLAGGPSDVGGATVLAGDSLPAADPDPDVPDEPVPAPASVRKPTSSEAAARFRIGYEHYRKEQFSEAFREFTEAIELDPTAPEPHVGMAKAYESLNYAQRAVEAYREAIELDPAYHGARVALARLLCDFGKNEESLALLRDAEKTDQRDPLVWAEIAVNEIRLGKPEEAIDLLQKYNRENPGQEWGFVHLGRAYADVKNFEAAEEAYRRGLGIDPNSELGNKWLAELLRDTGRRQQAEPLFEKFRRLRQLGTKERELQQAAAGLPDDVNQRVALLVKLAEIRQRLGRHREALISLRGALELMPGDPRLQNLYTEQSRRVR